MNSKKNPVLIEAKRRGDFQYFAYQLRYGKNFSTYRKKDVEKALPFLDTWALEAVGL